MGSIQAIASILSKKPRLAISLGAAATTSTVYFSLYTVKSDQRAVLFDRFRGTLPESVGEGTHFLIPWVQKPYIFDIGPRPHTFSCISANTKDLRTVNLSVRVVSRPDPQHLSTGVQNLGLDYKYDMVLPCIAIMVLEEFVAGHNADELFTLRNKISDLVRDTFVQSAKNFNILVDDVAVIEFFEKEAKPCYFCTNSNSNGFWRPKFCLNFDCFKSRYL
jgi:prohibitin 1